MYNTYEKSQYYLLIRMWDSLCSEIEEGMGNRNIEFYDWIEVLDQYCSAEYFAYIPFTDRVYEKLSKVICIVLGSYTFNSFM